MDASVSPQLDGSLKDSDGEENHSDDSSSSADRAQVDKVHFIYREGRRSCRASVSAHFIHFHLWSTFQGLQRHFTY